jgi:osmotically-inducible protein OsmY
VPQDRAQTKVENGWITLEGEVDWQYQRKAAERAVRSLTGVKGVVNLIEISSRVSTYDVSQRINEALRRRAKLDADNIDVEARNGTVTLKGTVHSWTEHAEAESAAWGAVGVTRVDDRLTVRL